MSHYFYLFIFVLFSSQISSQSLTGLSGMFNIPTADISSDSKLSIGVNYIDKRYLEYSHGKNDVLIFFITLGYIPNFEISIRGTRQLNYKGTTHNIDRMASVKWKFLEEKGLLPSIAIGFQNPISSEEDANHFNSTYIVVTKHVIINSFLTSINFSLGHGFDWIKATDYQFIGTFGGVSFSFFNFIDLINEYDAEHFNVGISIDLLNHIHLLAGYFNFRYFSAGASLSLYL